MFSRMACSRKSGVVSMITERPLYSMSTEGRVRLSRGSEELQTTQSQPIVGTPIEVPLPSTVSVAFILPREPVVDFFFLDWLLLCKAFASRNETFGGGVFPSK